MTLAPSGTISEGERFLLQVLVQNLGDNRVALFIVVAALQEQVPRGPSTEVGKHPIPDVQSADPSDLQQIE